MNGEGLYLTFYVFFVIFMNREVKVVLHTAGRFPKHRGGHMRGGFYGRGCSTTSGLRFTSAFECCLRHSNAARLDYEE